MWNWGYISNRRYLKAGALKCPNCSLPTNTWPLHPYLYPSQPHRHGLFCRSLSGYLGGKRRAFARARETNSTRSRPGDYLTLFVREGNNRVVECCLYMGNTHCIYSFVSFSGFSLLRWQVTPPSLREIWVIPSSCVQPGPSWGPSWSGHWCESAVHEQAGLAASGDRDSTQCPSIA